jgi:hypothetical protein
MVLGAAALDQNGMNQTGCGQPLGQFENQSPMPKV